MGWKCFYLATMSLRAMSTPWLRAVCWANLLWVRMIPRHLCIIGQIFCLFCVKAMFVCFTNILESCNTPPRKPCRGHCHSLSNPTRQKTFLRTEDFQKKTSLGTKEVLSKATSSPCVPHSMSGVAQLSLNSSSEPAGSLSRGALHFAYSAQTFFQ